MKKLSIGIYRDAYGIRAIVNIAAGRKEKRFPPDATLAEIKRWRNETRVKLETLHPQRRAGAMGRGTFHADLKRYIAGLTIASWKSRRSELRAWATHLGPRRRARITREHVERVVKAWVSADPPVPPKTILNRVRALTAMYHRLDGTDAWTPADGVALPTVTSQIPPYVPPTLVVAVERALAARELAGEVAPVWRARFMVLAACGARPVHVKTTTPTDVDLERGTWNIRAAKGGRPVRVELNDDMRAAWGRFIEVGAWGEWDNKAYASILRSAGWPEHLRPYALKHAFGQDLVSAGVGIEAIADWYGHTDSKTARIYTGRTKLQHVSAAVTGRLGWGPPKTEALSAAERQQRIAALQAEIAQLSSDADSAGSSTQTCKPGSDAGSGRSRRTAAS